ncbi:MAG: hypothetical protein ABJB98_08175 [Actinomycetota bacterium]
MPMDLEQQILKVLRGMRSDDRPATIGDLARRFGANSHLVAGCAQQMVDKGLAQPSMIEVSGAKKLQGLLPQPASVEH